MGFIVELIGRLFDLYTLLIIARVVVSWLDVSRYHPAVRFLVDVTEPVLAPVRRLIPPRAGLDLSPMVALVGIWVLRGIVVRLLWSLLVF